MHRKSLYVIVSDPAELNTPASAADVASTGFVAEGSVGPEGPAGPQGIQGETGPQGPAGSSAWADITGKPSTFTPSTHSHAIADVTGLQTTLDAKAAASHNHDGSYAAINHNHDAAYLALGHASVTNARKPAYVSGDGGTVTQATSKSTGVTLHKLCGEIVLNAAALAAAGIVSFTLTNSTIAATDVLILNHVTTGTRGAYGLNAQCGAGSAVVYVRNNSAGSLSEAIVIRFAVVKAVTA